MGLFGNGLYLLGRGVVNFSGNFDLSNLIGCNSPYVTNRIRGIKITTKIHTSPSSEIGLCDFRIT